VYYLDFLRGLHERLTPRTYLEIGVAQGHSLALSRCRSIGIDPEFVVNQQIVAPTSLVRMTSGEYFERLERTGTRPFRKLPIDLAFIDGMHHFEYALRDFIGVERYCIRQSVVAFDDVLPRHAAEAARGGQPPNWAGDVFRIGPALATSRPDLRLLTVATEPTGTLIVTEVDPSSRELEEHLDDIVREHVQPDPQSVPPEVLERTHAIAAQDALDLELWEGLRDARKVET
jgi:Methyltransferase domain